MNLQNINRNSCIELCNNSADVLERVKNEDLADKVDELLTMWKDDGTLEEIINVDIFNKLKVDLIKQLINKVSKNELSEINVKLFGTKDDSRK